MFIKIQDHLINLDNVFTIYPYVYKKHYHGKPEPEYIHYKILIVAIGATSEDEIYREFTYNTEQERDLIFNKIQSLIAPVEVIDDENHPLE